MVRVARVAVTGRDVPVGTLLLFSTFPTLQGSLFLRAGFPWRRPESFGQSRRLRVCYFPTPEIQPTYPISLDLEVGR